jgi:hypothetical protein
MSSGFSFCIEKVIHLKVVIRKFIAVPRDVIGAGSSILLRPGETTLGVPLSILVTQFRYPPMTPGLHAEPTALLALPPLPSSSICR